MANEITFTVKLDDKGSLALVTKEAKKTAAGLGKVEGATKKANKSQDHFARGAKGVGQAGLSASKGFSKMRDSMSGSNGLVSAYAILAANIFAATAAFNALRRAAQIEQLEKGLRLVGAAAGQNLPDVAKQLRDITGAAISSEQAMRATAVAMSAGFRSDQLLQLTKVAKGASIALGRDMGDALDRLVRGTAKLEPEILDELGIMVRLDDAVQNYADRLGLAAGQVTQFDRRQAFLNATIEQGIKKFEDLSTNIDSNPYDKLAASLADLQKAFINGTSALTGLSSAIDFASRHLASLTAVGTTLALGITRGVAPGMFRLADSAAATANGALTARAELAGLATEGNKLPPKFAKLAGALQNGTATSKEFATANNSLQGQLGGLTRGLNGLTKGTEEYASKSAEIQGVRNQMKDLAELEDLQGKARVTNARATAIGSAANFDLKDSFGSLKTAFKEDKINTEAATKGKKGLRNSLKTMGPAFRIAGTGAKAFGAALFTALPYIGLIISAVTVLYGVLKDKFFPEDLVKKRIDDAIDSFKQFGEIADRFETSTATGSKRLANSYIAFAGILDQISGKIREVSTANVGELVGQMREETLELEKQEKIAERNRALHESLTTTSVRYRGIQTDINNALSNALTAEKEIVRLKEAQVKAGERLSDMEKKTASEILQGALLQLRVQAGVAENTQQSAFSISLMKKSMAELAELNEALTRKDNPISFEEFLIQFELLQRYPNEVRATFQSIEQTVATFNGVMAKRNQKVKTLFSEEQDAAQGVIDRLVSLNEAAQETFVDPMDAYGGQSLTSGAIEARGLIIALEEEIANMNIPKTFGSGQEAVQAFIDRIIEARGNINLMTNTLATSKEQLKQIGKATKGIIGGQKFLHEQTNLVLIDELALLDEKIKFGREMHDVEGELYEDTEAYNALLELRNKIDAQRTDETVIQKMHDVDQLKILKKVTEMSKKRLSNEQKLRNIITQARASGGTLSPQQELKIQIKLAETKIKTAKLDLDFTLAKIKAERALLVAQMTANKVKIGAQNEILALLDAQNDVVEQMARQSVGFSQTGVTSAIQGSMSGFDTGFDRMGSNGLGVEGFKMQMEGIKNLAVAQNVLTEATKNSTKAQEKFETLQAEATAAKGTPEEGAANQAASDALLAAQAAEAVVLQAQTNVKNAALQMVSDTMTGLSKTLEQLGPDGALAAAFGNLGNIMLTSVVSALEVMREEGGVTAKTLAAGFAAAANIIGGIASILSAQANQQVAAVDEQIEAEKKRDGQSAASVAKMKAMEAKKDQIKRKAFETNKKMMIAQAIMSTAAGVAGALAVGSIYEVPVGMIMAGMIAAMGAAQVAIISGMSYQGGGSAPSAAKPSAINVGERNNTVDLARGNNAGGELAYMRGEQGTGTGATNFKPTGAFTGARYRASGGETAGFMVGEQGPELFIPDRSGRIAPADETAAMATTSNVNFNISAVDAAGVEDVLVRQKGHIIRMIREAANEHGQPFLETISDGAYTD